MKIKIDYEKCSVWWCFKNRAGYVHISAEGTNRVERIPYCEKHGEIVKEVIKEKYSNPKEQ